MADPHNEPTSGLRAIRSLRPDEFDASIFEKVASPGEEDRPDEDDDLEMEEPAPQREGLPPGFRMRHDSHYVEELVSRIHPGRIHMISTSEIDDPRPAERHDLQPLVASVADFGVLQPLLVRRLDDGRYELIAGSRRLAAAIAAGLDRVPCLVHSVDDERAQALASAERLSLPRHGHRVREPESAEATLAASAAKAYAEVGESLDAIGACLHLFRDTARPAPERIALDLIEAEVSRATWLVQALSVLDEDPPVANGAVDLESIVKRIADTLTPRRYHAGPTVEVDVSSPGLRARGDEMLLTVAVAGIVMALQATVERVETAVVRLQIREEPGDRVRVEATQDALRMPASWHARFLDPQWTDRPGGRRIAVALAASQRIAELHGGTLTAGSAEHGGCRLVLSLPRA